MTPPDEIAGYKAAVHHAWALGRPRRPGFVPTLGQDSRDEGS